MHLEPTYFEWLTKLYNNNNRDWYQENKKDFEKYVRTPFKQLVTELIENLHAEGLLQEKIEARKTIFRINRDTRFSKDKTPYKTNTAALISDAGTKDKMLPGFYLHIEIGRLMVGGGAYFMDKDMLYNIRQKLVNGESKLPELLGNKSFKEIYGELQGEKNKRLPKEFMEKAQSLPLLFNKQFFYMAEYPVDKIMQADAIPFLMQHLRAGQPINESLKAAMP